MSEKPKPLSIKELLTSNDYVIPIYQRNYAWKEPEITQLIQDIIDYAKKDIDIRYYLGTLIVYERKENQYETIDGQQRLTTLSILASLIKNEYEYFLNQDEKFDYNLSWYERLNLRFDSRKRSTETLQALFDGKSLDNKECESDIKQGYEIAKKSLKKLLNEKEFKLSITEFAKYLFENVYILRVLVPEDTDLNHYFEIMNTRGEQLEKHEVLKANYLAILDEKDRYIFNLIWEACSNMERYIQYGFPKMLRERIFGKNLETLIPEEKCYEEVEFDSSKSNNQKNNEHGVTLLDLINGNYDFSQNQILNHQNDEDTSERFNSIINFPNFLLHILKIMVNIDEKFKNLDKKIKDIPLDDKSLLDIFNENFLKNEEFVEKKKFVKKFGYYLLKGKFLFDTYIIKREFLKGKDSWSLKKLKLYEKNRIGYINTFDDENKNKKILMLLSMFHVSFPTQVYKHWLNGALKYLFEKYYNENSINPDDYKDYLENLAKAFLCDRFLAKNPKDYYEIIYQNQGKSVNTDIDESKLNQGTVVENFIFNYLDYLLWQDYKGNKEYFNVEGREINDERIEKFEFTFRSSVEHYYPRNPIDGRPIDKKWLDHFGNLCLISSSKNSRLSNFMPKAKKEYYQKSSTIDSIKQRVMMEYEYWDDGGDNQVNEIKEHGEKMIKLLISHCKNN